MSDPTPALASALVAALADLSVINTGRTVNTGTYSYDYADLGDAVKLTRPALAEHGIVALTPVHDHGNGLACTVILLHESGERMDLGPFPFPHGNNAQATGSMVTYHRRYALVAALGMAAGDDDDGATATARQATPAGPSAISELAAAPLWDLPDDVAAEIRGRLEDKAGVPMSVALEDEGWRTWLAGAIKHHKAKERQ